MSTKITDLRTGIATALATVNGAGAYTNNLSTSGQVVTGVYAVPPLNGVPVVMLGGMSLESVHGEQLGRYTRRVEWSLVCFAPATVDNPAERMLAMENLLNDITIALEVAVRGTTGVAPTITGWADVILESMAETAELDGDAAGCVTFIARFGFYTRANNTGGV